MESGLLRLLFPLQTLTGLFPVEILNVVGLDLFLTYDFYGLHLVHELYIELFYFKKRKT